MRHLALSAALLLACVSPPAPALVRGPAPTAASGPAPTATPSPAPTAAPSPAPAAAPSPATHPTPITEANWAQRTLYSWTTAAQVAELRASRTLLTATRSTHAPPSPFVFALETHALGRTPAAPLAQLLARDPRFLRRRYAWTSPFATVLGLGTHGYGDDLIEIRLHPTAWIVAFEPDASAGALLVRDLEQNPIPLEQALRHPERIAAVYHVRTGKDVPAPFREYVVVNESAVDEWSIGTERIQSRISADAAFLGRSAAPDAATWRDVTAFRNDRYAKPDGKRLAAILEALAAYRPSAPPLVIRQENPKVP